MAKALKVEDELIVEKVSLLCFKNEVEIMIIGGVFFSILNKILEMR